MQRLRIGRQRSMLGHRELGCSLRSRDRGDDAAVAAMNPGTSFASAAHLRLRLPTARLTEV